MRKFDLLVSILAFLALSASASAQDDQGDEKPGKQKSGKVIRKIILNGEDFSFLYGLS